MTLRLVISNPTSIDIPFGTVGSGIRWKEARDLIAGILPEGFRADR
jgi:hypothetical protein